MAGTTGFEPATSDVTGRRSNQLNYHPAKVVGGGECRGGIGPGLGQNLIVRLGAQSSPLRGRHSMRLLIDPHATARLLRCSRSAHGMLPFGPK